MFDRCGRWRRRLQRRADGTLSARHWGALDDHLSQCADCRQVAAADRALRETLRTHLGLLDSQAAGTFDDRVIRRLAIERSLPHRTLLSRMLSWWSPRIAVQALPFRFMSQIAAGACAAAVITSLCLAPALHPSAARADLGPVTGVRSSLPPVPLESLLDTASPCAALLWAAPHAHHGGVQTPPSAKVRPPAAPKPLSPRQETPSIRDRMG
jgi:anti-sigma factor RsiW